MAIDVASGFVTVLTAWFAAGLVVAVAFVLFGAGRIDPAARSGSRGFRLLIVPGVAAFWPLLLKRWLGGTREPPAECNAHRRAAANASAKK
ncbi:MAG: hypothetical protein AB8G17_03015 [Gammaproteobacteria bacterium]